MTMANSAVSSTPRNGVSLRKTNKPLMEKRRRARINDSLGQLKSLVIHSSKKDSSQFSKLEKADILELTVKHLRGLQQQQQQQQQQQMNQATAVDNSINNKYRAGFVECANEVIRYLDQSQNFGNNTKAKVISHLAQCLQLVSHVQPKQVTAPAAPTATILSAPSAATATTQLPNGQIIQIVSNPVQNIQSTTATGILGFKQPVTSLQGLSLTSGINPSSSAVSAVAQSNPATAQTAYVRYAQPLHIQIPPIMSPVLIQQTQPAKQDTIGKDVTASSTRSSPAEHAHDVVSSSTNMLSPLPPASSSSSSTSSTPPSHSSLPKVRAQKQLNFYSPEEMNADMLAMTRTYSFNSSSSSSSSSSSESEMTSPLNLSQSPPFPSQKFETRLPHHNPSHQHRHHHHPTTVPSSSSVSHISKISEQYQVSQPIPIKAHDKPTISTIPVLHNGYSFHDRESTLNTTSVIVNSRKFPEFPESKYFHMMDDDRHCINHQSTPSPASSMGEERLWRPW